MIALLASLVLQAAALPPPGLTSHEEDDGRLAFSYAWPRPLDGIAPLRAALAADLDVQRREARSYVAEGQREARRNRIDFIPHYYAKGWSLDGRGARLISIHAAEETFSGGAHGNVAFDALLWDLAGARRVEAREVLGTTLLAAITPRFCAALNADRAERRSGEPPPTEPVDPNDSHVACPPLAERALAPTDGDGDGRFDGVLVLIPPYVAGPYVEGAYLTEVTLTEADIGLIPAAWRDSFEPAAAQ